MVVYGEIVKEFFASLKKCNITPILVFDGSVIGKQSTKDQLALKEGAIYKRGLERFQLAKTFSEDNPDDRLCLPHMINRVFKTIVIELGIQKIQSPYEADTHIARIANDLNCPVLSDDSDFLIYSLPQGFILLSYFFYKDIVTSKEGQNYLKCFICSQEKLIKCLPGLRPDNMPLLSILLGNDYVEAGAFDRVLDVICNQPYRGTLQAAGFNQRRIANLLAWFQKTTLDDAIDYILSLVRPISREGLRKTIRILLRNYKIEETDNFEAELLEIYPPAQANPNQTDSHHDNNNAELMPAAYLRHLFESGDLSSMALDIIFHNTHYNYAIIDDFDLTSSSYVKYRPYSLAVTLLRPRSYSNMTTYRRQVESEKDSFFMFDRISGEYTRIVIRPIETLDGFGSLEHFNCYSMITLDPSLKRSLVMNIFRFNENEMSLIRDIMSKVFVGHFVQESCICFLLVKYIGLETKRNPKPQFVDALMLTLFYYAALNGQLNENSFVDSAYGKLLLRLRPHATKCNDIQYGSSPSIYRRVIHFISQLQCAYSAFHLLNSLLDQVFQVEGLEKFFNGILIFRLTKLLRVEELNMITLCSELSVLSDASSAIRTMVNCDE